MITEDKAYLRQKFLAIRRSMDSKTIANKSTLLANRIIEETDWQNIHSMHCFLPLLNDNEPDMRPVIEHALRQGIEVSTTDPSSVTGRRVMELADNRLQAMVAQYDITDNQQFDLIIVPMLAYDPATNHRLGFGGGFYDRMLPKQPTARKLGVCFTELATPITSEPHDIKLEAIFAA